MCRVPLTAIGLVGPVGAVVVAIAQVVAWDALPVLARRLGLGTPARDHGALCRANCKTQHEAVLKATAVRCDIHPSVELARVREASL